MKEFRIRPKSDYMHTASIESLYALTEHWESDMQFYTDEIAFLQGLFDKYFVLMSREDKIDLVQAEANELLKLNDTCDELKKRMKKHQLHLEELEENAFSHDEQSFRDEHGKLEDDFSAFVKRFREVKKNVFTISEEAMEVSKESHLIKD